MKTAVALRALAIGLTGLALVGQPNASADKAQVEEFYGTGFREASVLSGQHKGIHAEGTLTASIRAEAPGVPRIDYRPMQLWVHFGHRHDVGFDFLCQDLPGH